MTERQVRQITDSRVLAAMAHPLRRRLMDVLRVYGPATASMLADRTDQGVGNISHHLRVLASGDLVEEATELARDRRERWWRPVGSSLRWSHRDFADDPAGEIVTRAAESLVLERQVEAVRGWFAGREGYDPAWVERGAFSTDVWLHLTPDEAFELAEEVTALLHRWRDREVPDDGQHRDPVFAFARAAPSRP